MVGGEGGRVGKGGRPNSDTRCLQTSFLIFKFCQPQSRRILCLTANKALVGRLITVDDITMSIAITPIPYLTPQSLHSMDMTDDRICLLFLRLQLKELSWWLK